LKLKELIVIVTSRGERERESETIETKAFPSPMSLLE